MRPTEELAAEAGRRLSPAGQRGPGEAEAILLRHRERTYLSLRYRTPEGEVHRQLGLELNVSSDGRWHVASVYDDIHFQN